jgi:hypothetical protein
MQRVDASPIIQRLVQLALDQGEWEYSLDILEGRGWKGLGKDRSEFIAEVAKTDRLVESILVPRLAHLTDSQRIGAPTKERLTEQARRVSPNVETAVDVHNARSFRQFGAALERVGKDLDALGFYESLINTNWASEDLRQYANKRWIHVKFRQANRERQANRRAVADRYKEQAEARLRTFDWRMTDIGPEYPDMTLIERGYETASRLSIPQVKTVVVDRNQDEVWKLGSLTFRRYAAGNRVNIESALGEQARIDLSQRSVSSSDVAIAQPTANEWTCDSWGLIVRFDEPASIAAIRAGDQERKISLPALSK